MRFWFRENPIPGTGPTVTGSEQGVQFSFNSDGDVVRGEFYAIGDDGEEGVYVLETQTRQPEADLCTMYRESVSRAHFVPFSGSPVQIASGDPRRIALRFFVVLT